MRNLDSQCESLPLKQRELHKPGEASIAAVRELHLDLNLHALAGQSPGLARGDLRVSRNQMIDLRRQPLRISAFDTERNA